MRLFLIIISGLLVINNVKGQTSFSTVESELSISKTSNGTELICSSATMLLKFKLKHKLTIMPQKNILSIDSQIIQITPLKVDGYKKDVDSQNINDQKALLLAYSKYELDYYKNNLHVELINPSNQWVIIKSKGWFIWYFKVGNVPIHVAKQTQIQLFASTIIGNNILTINAPMFTDADFTKAGLIVNDMMETLTIVKQ